MLVSKCLNKYLKASKNSSIPVSRLPLLRPQTSMSLFPNRNRRNLLRVGLRSSEINASSRCKSAQAKQQYHFPCTFNIVALTIRFFRRFKKWLTPLTTILVFGFSHVTVTEVRIASVHLRRSFLISIFKKSSRFSFSQYIKLHDHWKWKRDQVYKSLL